MKIAIVGIGRVGSTLAYTRVIRGLCDELILINRRREIAEGDAHDLRHAVAFVDRRIEVYAGDIADSTGADIIAICASVPLQEKTTDRLALGPGNAELFRQLIPQLAEVSPNAVFLVLTNPVDIMTYLTIQLSGLPPWRVMGTGTLIDSARFREMLSDEIGIHPDDLRAYILGEHGPHQFPALSQAQVAGERIEDNEKRRQMFRDAVEADDRLVAHVEHTSRFEIESVESDRAASSRVAFTGARRGAASMTLSLRIPGTEPRRVRSPRTTGASASVRAASVRWSRMKAVSRLESTIGGPPSNTWKHSWRNWRSRPRRRQQTSRSRHPTTGRTRRSGRRRSKRPVRRLRYHHRRER